MFEDVNKSYIMQRVYPLRFSGVELSIIEKCLDKILEKHQDLLEVPYVYREEPLLFIETRELDPRCNMVCHPRSVTTRFVIDTKNNKWGTYEEKMIKEYSWEE